MNLSPVGQVFVVVYDGEIEIVFDSYQEANRYVEESNDTFFQICEYDVWDNAEVHLT